MYVYIHMIHMIAVYFEGRSWFPLPRHNVEAIRAALDTWATELRPGQLQAGLLLLCGMYSILSYINHIRLLFYLILSLSSSLFIY